AEAPEERKVVSVVQCELRGLGEGLDPERFRALFEQFAETCEVALEAEGGTVEAISRNAVVGVFGLARVREDDALRAVRAAGRLEGTLPTTGLEAGVGVATGELVVGGRLSVPIGDAADVAAMLGAGTGPGA